MQIDIRLLLLSLLLHLSIYGLMSVWRADDAYLKQNDLVEIVFKNEAPSKKEAFIPKLDYTKMEDTSKKASVMAEEQIRVKQESLARNTGVTQNSVPNQQQPSTEKSYALDKSGFKPLEKNPNISRTSSIHLDLPHIPDASMTFLNADFSTYASFFNRITPNIINYWGQNISEFAYFPQIREQIVLKDRWSTRVEVILDQKGYLKNIIVVNSSGLRELDEAIVDAIQRSGPFLNPPTGLVESDGFVHIHGQFNVLTRRPRVAY